MERRLIEDLEAASGMPAKCFHIKGMSKGSILVDIEVHPNATEVCPDPASVAQDLTRQARDPSSRLKAGGVTARASRIEAKSRASVALRIPSEH